LTCLDEFQASSKELEDELERELSATEKQQTELKEKIKRLEAEKDEWKVSRRLLFTQIARVWGPADVCRTNT
jgi:DNA-binding transcriptional regulator GbsR (MarR family)